MRLQNPSTATLQMIPEGVAGIAATLKAMGQLVKDGKKSMNVRDITLRLVANCPPKDWSCEVRVIHAFVRDNIRYVGDISGVETLHTADKILEQRAGDCDDKSILLCSMLECIEHPTRFIAIGFQPGIFSHVYVETKIGNRWIPLETTEDVEVGWQPEPNMIMARMYFNN